MLFRLSDIIHNTNLISHIKVNILNQRSKLNMRSSLGKRRQGFGTKLSPGQLFSSKHLALWRKVDWEDAQQVRMAVSH